MGGYGSTRWNWHNKKLTVEDCRKLTIYELKPYLRTIGWGKMTWTRGGRQVAAISFRVTGQASPEAVRLIYTITDQAGAKAGYDYPIPLTWTVTPWGARRYWFTCPLSRNGRTCGRRVGALYLPPGGRFFGCRHCYDLTYTSSQESGKWDRFYNLLAAGMQADVPGMTAADLHYSLDKDCQGSPPPGGYYDLRYRALLQSYLDNFPDPYADYMTRADLCERSGLTPDNLAALEAARLLLPDRDGKYRPKLAGWGRKLATLLGEGWQLDELQAWARGRWTSPNPRRWPPDREAWKSVTSG